MAYRNDNVPVTDLLVPLNTLPHTPSRAVVTGQGRRDTLGRYVEGSIKVTHENLEGYYQSVRNAVGYQADVRMRQIDIRQSGSKPMCIIAMSPNFGYSSSSQDGIVLQQEKNLVSAYGDRDGFIYFLAVLGGLDGISIDGVGSLNYVNVVTSVDEKYIDDYPAYTDTTEQIRTSNLSRTMYINQVKAWMDYCNTGREGFYTTQRFTPQERVEAERWTAAEPFTDYGNSIYLSCPFGNMVTGSGTNAVLYPVIGGKITSNIPVFGMLQTQAIYDYFHDGKIDDAENLEDLTVSDVSLATDWIIYVKGKRYPDIFVTMASTELDDFLADPEKNVAGLSANDFKIQYRYVAREIDSYYGTYSDGETVDFMEDMYNNTYLTSWKDLAQLNYGSNYSFVYANTQISAKMGEPCNLQFRVYYNDETWSSWCYFKIGFIGSPTVSDFKYMNNEGDVLGISDGSTVTIIYDEFPPDIDDGYKDPKDDSDITDTENNDSVTVGYNLLTTSYRMTDTNVQLLGGKLWSQSFWDNIKLLNNSPIENIVALKIMPCLVNAHSSNVVIGNVDMEIAGERVTSVPVVTVGSFNFQGHYGNFLDYAPYTRATLFLPFIGFVEIDPAEFTGHVLTVKYAFDIVMGECKAMLFADNIYCHSYDGVCGIDVPLVASNRAQVEGGMVAGMASAATKGDIVGFANNFITAQYHSQRAGGYSSTLGWVETRNCFIVLDIPNAQYPSTYAHDIGYPCNLSCTLGTLSGFTVCGDNIDMRGFTCTEEEKEQIKQLLQSGVYL